MFAIPRLIIYVVLLLVQIIALGFLSVWILYKYPVLSHIGTAISVLVFFYLLKKDEASAYKLTWIIVILAFLPLGGLIYLAIGNKRHTRKIAAHVKEHDIIARLLDRDENILNKIKDSRVLGLMAYIRRLSSYHVYTATQAKYYKMGEDMFKDMLESMETAKKFIFIEFFIVKKSEMWDKTLDVLERKASEGVEVRLIVDDLGSNRLLTKDFGEQIKQKGIKLMRFNPMMPLLLFFMNHRDHRKIIVVDGHTAFCGGINISDEYINKINPYGIWKDTGIKLIGEAVWSFSLMFIETWDTFCKPNERINDYDLYRLPKNNNIKSDGYILPYGDTPLDKETLGENIYIDLLNQAKVYVYIFTPYLIISEKLAHALQMAAKRGVDVKIIMPGIPDKSLIYRLSRSYYQHLLEAGVRIFEYTPGFIHAKCFISDDSIGVVGTINLDYRSLYLHFECAILLYKTSVIKDMYDDATHTISLSKEVSITRRKQWMINELGDAVLHLFAPLL